MSNCKRANAPNWPSWPRIFCRPIVAPANQDSPQDSLGHRTRCLHRASQTRQGPGPGAGIARNQSVWLQPALQSGVDPDRVDAVVFALKLLLATVGAVAAAWYAIASINPSGILPTNWTAVVVVSQHCPVHLVRFEWIPGTDQTDILFAWIGVETKARLALVCALWLIIVGALVWRALPRRPWATPLRSKEL